MNLSNLRFSGTHERRLTGSRPKQAKGLLRFLILSKHLYNHTPLVSVVSDAERHYDRAIKLLEQGDYAAGVSELKLAIRISPDYPEALCKLGEVYSYRGQCSDELAGQEHEIYRAADEIVERLRFHPASREFLDAKYEREIARRYRDAHIRERDISFSAASGCFDAATTRRPGYADAYFYRGLAKFNNEYVNGEEPDSWRSGGYDYGEASTLIIVSAIDDFSKAIRLNPQHFQARKHRGIAFVGLNLYEIAVADLDVAIRLNPNDAETYSHRSKAYRGLGRYADAIADLDVAYRLSPDLKLLWERERLSLLAAITELDGAITLRPNYPEFYVVRGYKRLELREYVSAITDFDAAIRLHPASRDAFKYRGIAKLKLNRYADAVSDFDVAIRHSSDDAELYRHRLAAKRHLGEAVTLLRYDEHIGMQLCVPNDDSFKNEIAARRQHLKSLRKDYDNLIRLEPENRTAYLYRGAVNLDLGEHGAAFADFDAAVKLNPDDGLAYLKRAEAMFSLLMNDLRAAEMRDRRLDRYIDNLIERMLSELNPYPLRLERFKPTLF